MTDQYHRQTVFSPDASFCPDTGANRKAVSGQQFSSISISPRLFHVLAAAAMLLLSLLPIGSQAAQQAPSAFLHDIYKHYVGTNAAGVKLDSDADYNRYFTPDLAKIITADNAKAAQVGDIPSLEGDPFIDAQDWSIASFKIAVDDKATDKTVAKVSFKSLGEMKTATLDLIRVDGAWKIDDIHWPDYSLRGLFKQ